MDKKIIKVHDDIKKVKIQGAANIAKAVGQSLLSFVLSSKKQKNSEIIDATNNIGKYLTSARETEPMAENVFGYWKSLCQENKFLPNDEFLKQLHEKFSLFLALLNENEERISTIGAGLIKNNERIFTHCHSSAVVNSLLKAKKSGLDFEVFQTETRPLFQGRKTAENLVKNKIKDTLVVDSAAPYLLSSFSNEKINFDKLFLGCDEISGDGSCVNKVGSFALSLSAYQNKIQIYILTQGLKLNCSAKNFKQIEIERRPASEIWKNSPRNLKMLNLAFDLVPADFITAYVTEIGLIPPQNLRDAVMKNYIWLNNKK